ncbi:hypothetical protein [Yoonia sp. I 8.24]|uniref:hypothetical protein n=1 Tax=Yoonia sp. I 8.24 TaxID=1537229 RepID=UPI001EDD12B9|nr:hypothetical protein [Yoonia sp. I 8.24]MCG3269003.1 hypothetical protein [Yoonia sp. I 8.24]
MTDSTVHALATVTAPADFGTRGLPRATKPKSAAFWDNYDNDTLIYDCFGIGSRGIVRLTMPKLLGFKKRLLSADFTINGQQIRRKKLKQNLKHDVLDLYVDSPAGDITITSGSTLLHVPVRLSDPARYAGCNVLYTQIKNDDLQWVYDWGCAHQRNHGVDAILVTNNGSTAYTSEALRQVLASIPNLKVADVLDAPLSHGAHHQNGAGTGATKFLQPALLNLTRDRFFEQARAVLVCDVDELVQPAGTESIFDATVASQLKYKSFQGVWRYAQTSDAPVRHADHIWAKPEGTKCASKYCIVPNSLFGRMTWGVHSLEAINRHIFRPSNRFQFFHCRQISTSWKSDRSAKGQTDMAVDPKTQDFMSATFPPEVEL